MIEEFLSSLRERGYSPATLDVSSRWLEHFETRIPKPLRDIKPSDLSEYHKSLQWEPRQDGKLYSENSVNQAVGVLKAYFRWCKDQGYVKTDPTVHLVTRRVPPKERVSLTPGQARQLLSLPDIKTFNGLRARAMLALLVEVQASPGSLSKLNLTDFQPDTGALLLKSRKGRRIVSLASGLQADLERYLRFGRAGVAQPGEQAFFVTKAGNRMDGQNARHILRDYCRKAGVPRPHFFS